MAKVVDGVMEQGWLYQDGLNPVAELDGSGQVVSRFVYGTSGHVPTYMLKDGVTYALLSDVRGSVRRVVEVSTGAVVQELEYSPFGRVLVDTNPGFQPFGYAGGLYDVDTGLVRFGARDYDGGTGRWTAKDPIGFSGGDANLYGYVLADPVNGVDPSGLDWIYVPYFDDKRAVDLFDEEYEKAVDDLGDEASEEELCHTAKLRLKARREDECLYYWSCSDYWPLVESEHYAHAREECASGDILRCAGVVSGISLYDSMKQSAAGAAAILALDLVGGGWTSGFNVGVSIASYLGVIDGLL